VNRAERRQAAKREAIKAAMSVADDVAAGRLDPAELDAAAAAECRALFLGPAVPGDLLWDLHHEVCLQHLAAGGVSAGELSEWLGLARHRECGDGPPAVGADVPSESETSADGPHGAQFGGAADVYDAALPQPEDVSEPDPEPKRQLDEVNPYGPARRILARGRGLPIDNGLRPM
jgi:hypothetical protein